MQAIQIGENKYEIASEELRISTGYIHNVWVRLGKPDRLEGSAWKLVDAMMEVWASLYPWEIKAFKQTIQEDQSIERSVSESMKAGGAHIPISYPTRLLQLLKLYFPNERYADRKLILDFVQRYPILQVTKYHL